MILGDLLLCMRKVCCCWKKLPADGKPAHDHTGILTDSARKRNRKAAHKKQQKYTAYGWDLPNNILYSCFEGTVEPEFSDILWLPTRISGPKIFLKHFVKKTLSIPQAVTSDIWHCFTVPVLLITLN